MLDLNDIIAIGNWIGPSKAYYLQQFVNTNNTLDPTFKKVKCYTPEELNEMQNAVKKHFQKMDVRGI